MTTQITTTSATEKREFRLHKDILWSIIKSQAGTLGKAILELVMNSIDAGATEIKINLTQQTVSVSDDGKGFTDRREIEEFFETFGTPHEKGDAKYGRFRMGRGQIMAFTKNKWASGVFRMNVDIRDLGLAYELNVSDKIQSGCSISGEMYDELSPSELIRATDNLRDLCKYAPIPVLVNGVNISTDMNSQKWTLEDDDAWYLLRPAARYIETYNLGIHVKNYFAGDFGIGGIVVSKKQLEVNFARNDILVGECAVWKRMNAKIKAYAKQFEDKKVVQNESYREIMMAKLTSGSFDGIEDVRLFLKDAKIFTDYNGKHFSFDSLLSAVNKANGKLICCDNFSAMADRVSQKRMAVVLSPITLERANGMSMHKILQRLSENIKTLSITNNDRHSYVSDKLSFDTNKLIKSICSLESVSEGINDKHEIIDEKSLTKEEKLTLKIINDVQWLIVHSMNNFYNESKNIKERNVRVCESEVVEGYTDGDKVIFINREFLKIGGCAGNALAKFESIKNLLIHEYLHDENDSDGHDHPAEFYKDFHDITTTGRNHYLSSFCYRITMEYIKARQKAGYKMRSGDFATMDLLSKIDDTKENNVVEFNQSKDESSLKKAA
jgi:hypothetical protein